MVCLRSLDCHDHKCNWLPYLLDTCVCRSSPGLAERQQIPFLYSTVNSGLEITSFKTSATQQHHLENSIDALCQSWKDPPLQDRSPAWCHITILKPFKVSLKTQLQTGCYRLAHMQETVASPQCHLQHTFLKFCGQPNSLLMIRSYLGCRTNEQHLTRLHNCRHRQHTTGVDNMPTHITGGSMNAWNFAAPCTRNRIHTLKSSLTNHRVSNSDPASHRQSMDQEVKTKAIVAVPQYNIRTVERSVRYTWNDVPGPAPQTPLLRYLLRPQGCCAAQTGDFFSIKQDLRLKLTTRGGVRPECVQSVFEQF